MDDRAYSYDPVPGAPVSPRRTMEAGQLWRQYIIAAIASIAVATTGYSMGWTSPVNIKLKNENLTDTPLPSIITTDQESWIGSLLPAGAIFGPFVAGFLAPLIGRKWTLMASAIPQYIGWILIAVASEVEFIYAGRFFWGVGVGMIFTVTPMYCAEIATDEVRGALGSFVQVFVVFGFLLIYSIGPYISYYAIAYVGIVFVAAHNVGFYFMPETPIYHLSKNNREAAAECLMTIRGQSRTGVEAELDTLATSVSASMAKTATYGDIFKGGNFKAFYISCFLVFFQQFCGINAVLFYMTNIFEAAGSNLDSSIATIIIGAVQVGASCVCPFVVDRLGRRLLLLFSSCGTAIGLALLGMFFLLDTMGSPVVQSIGFLPVLSLIVFIITYCVGLGPLPWAVMGELMPIEVKSRASPIATAFCWALSFLITKYFGPISEAVGMYVAFWIFGVCCIASFFFSLLVVPETKGKSLSEIQDLLSGRPTKGKA